MHSSTSRPRRAPGAREASARRKRLVILFSTFIVGGGSAVAGIPEVRDALKSVFGATTAPSVASPEVSEAHDFGFGPLGDLLSLDNANRHRGQHNKGTHREASPGSDGRRGDATGGGRDRGAFSAPESGGGSGGAGDLHGTRAPGHGPDTTTGGPSPPSKTDGGTPTGPVDTNGNGLALGRDMPVPRRPAQSPSQLPGGRTDPPALGRDNLKPSDSNGKAKKD